MSDGIKFTLITFLSLYYKTALFDLTHFMMAGHILSQFLLQNITEKRTKSHVCRLIKLSIIHKEISYTLFWVTRGFSCPKCTLIRHNLCFPSAQVQKSPDNMRIMPNFNLKDSQGQTVLGLALWQGLHETAAAFLNAGANINERNAAGLALLHEAIEKQDTISALFLIEHHADLEAE